MARATGQVKPFRGAVAHARRPRYSKVARLHAATVSPLPRELPVTTVELKLEHCTIRSFHPGDEISLARHANNRKVWINLRDRFPHPYTETHAKSWIRQVEKQVSETSFAIAVDGDAVGGIGLVPGDDACIVTDLEDTGNFAGIVTDLQDPGDVGRAASNERDPQAAINVWGTI